MKFLEKLDFFKPLGKGLAEADTFMRREMPLNMSWGFPAAVLGATYFAPEIASLIKGSGNLPTDGLPNSSDSTTDTLSKLLKNQTQQPNEPQYTSNVASGFQYEDLNEPFMNPYATQQERTRKLLAQQLRLLNARKMAKKSSGGMRSLNIQDLFDKFGTLS